MRVIRSHPSAIVARMAMDQRGHRWRIAEMDAPHANDTSLSRCLVLSTDDRCLRLRSFPAEWQTATVETLLALTDAEACGVSRDEAVSALPYATVVFQLGDHPSREQSHAKLGHALSTSEPTLHR